MWLKVQDLMPILCVDVVPVQMVSGSVLKYGLITRPFPSSGQVVHCQIGGRVNRLETIRDAIIRHVVDALPLAEFDLPDDPQPDYVMQWFPAADQSRFGHDPRKHAVSLSFRLEISVGRATTLCGG